MFITLGDLAQVVDIGRLSIPNQKGLWKEIARIPARIEQAGAILNSSYSTIGRSTHTLGSVD